MTAASAGSAVWAPGGDRSDDASATMRRRIVSMVAICVLLQLGLTIALPGQSWSMPVGLAGLCFVCALVTVQVGARTGWEDRFGTAMVSAFFALRGAMWVAWVCGVGWNGDQSLSSLLSFSHLAIMIVILVPRGGRSDPCWPVAIDCLVGIVLCALVTTRIWPEAFVEPTLVPPRYLSYLEYAMFAALALASLYVQRRDPPIFLKPFAVAQCIYALTSILSLELVSGFDIPTNSPIWVYGDAAMIVYPFLANAMPPRTTARAGPDIGPAPNQVIPSLIAFLVLALAFGYAQREQMLAPLIGASALLFYACRVSVVTRQYYKLQAALIAAGQARVESLVDVVHELRSPLASVVLNASALARAENIPAGLKVRVDTIASRCGTVTRLLNDVLDLERIEAGLMEIAVAAVDVSVACRDALTAVATTADAAGVALRGPGEGAPGLLAEGDAGLLTRVVVNLLDNAIRFTPAGGVVTVSVARAGPAQVAIVVEDTGVGLSPDARATLFRRFGHAGDPVNGAKGSGLGLSISSSAIQAMEGRLDLTARDDGPGTRATILLKRRATP